MLSNNKIRKRLWLHRVRSCSCKKNYKLLKGLYRLFLLRLKTNGNINIYKCLHGNHYHVGNRQEKTIENYKYIRNLQKRFRS